MYKKAAIFIDHPRCSVDGVNAIINSLESKFRFKIFTKHEVHDNFFDDVDLIIVPGGLGDADTFKKVMKHHIKPIRDIVLNNGVHYLGICMGAYWAGPHYFNLLKDRDCVQYLSRPKTNTHRPHAKNLEVNWNGKKEKMFWYDGCSIIGSGKLDVVSYYPNGDVMAGYQGRIGLIGSHPEAEKHWYDEYTWMKKVWSEDNSNKQLLLEFTEELMKR
jgi:Glutamine amidotransferase class-I